MDGLIVDIVVEEEPLEDLNDERLWSYRQLMLAKLRRIARGESTLVEQERDVVHRKGVDIVRMQQTMGTDKRSLQMRRRLCQRSVAVTDS